MPALKLAEIVIVVVALVAFYVWQMRSLKRDRAETARQMAQAQASETQRPSVGADEPVAQSLCDSPPAAHADRSRSV